MKLVEKCGECNQPYSPECARKVQCFLHQGQCFACSSCHKIGEPADRDCLVTCLVCDRFGQVADSYFQMHCEQYICRYEFLGIELASSEVSLPCGHSQMVQHLITFMSKYCPGCGRIMLKGNQGQNICQICSLKQSSLDQDFKNSLQQNKESQNSQLQEVQISKNSSIIQTQQQIIKILHQDLQKVKFQLGISQFTRKQLKDLIVYQERDVDCPICLIPFHLNTKKPYMICMQQHLICEQCLKNPTLVECGLCRTAIQKDKVLPSRERLKTLEFQQFVCQKFKDKVVSYIEEKDKNKKEDKEVQTQFKIASLQQKEPDEEEEDKGINYDLKREKPFTAHKVRGLPNKIVKLKEARVVKKMSKPIAKSKKSIKKY